MKKVVFVLVALLFIAHQDNFLWGDDRLVFDFMPIGLFYHVCISLAATVTWFLATLYAWPASGSDEAQSDEGAAK
jgi:hypothetical protein